MAAEHVDAVSKAIESLIKWHKSQLETEKPKLFDQDEEFIYLILTLNKIPQKGRVNPHKIPIPHSLLSASSEQCLIIDDRPKSVHVTKKDAQKKIQSESIPITKVLKLSKLASDYRPFEAKRKLCNSYDLFFAEKSVVPLLPRLLGKQFFKKRKLPVQLDLKKKNWKEQVEKACASAMLFLRTGTCSVIKVAKLSMDKDEIVENVIAAMDGVVEIVPKNWANVRSFHVKLLDSVALPVFQAVPDVKLKIEGVKDVEAALKKVEKKKVRDAKAEKKKGRIHEIKYMDDKMSEDGTDVDGTDVDDGGEDKAKDDSENGEKENGGLVRSKRKKKGVKAKKEGSSEKPLKDSAKRRKKDGLSVKAAEEVLIKDGELSKKKKKGGEPSKKKKKGAEHDDVDGDAIDDGGEDGEATGGDDYENAETVSGGLVSRKRKKEIKAKKGDSPLKDSAKGKKKDVLSVKATKEGSIKKSGNKLSIENGSSGKKKMKAVKKTKKTA